MLHTKKPQDLNNYLYCGGKFPHAAVKTPTDNPEKLCCLDSCRHMTQKAVTQPKASLGKQQNLFLRQYSFLETRTLSSDVISEFSRKRGISEKHSFPEVARQKDRGRYRLGKKERRTPLKAVSGYKHNQKSYSQYFTKGGGEWVQRGTPDVHASRLVMCAAVTHYDLRRCCFFFFLHGRHAVTCDVCSATARSEETRCH